METKPGRGLQYVHTIKGEGELYPVYPTVRRGGDLCALTGLEMTSVARV